MNKRKNKELTKLIARTRINYLFNRAHKIFPSQKNLANRYTDLARRYAQRAKIKLSPTWKKRICHKCKSFLFPGLNCRTRLHSSGNGSHLSITCLECNQTIRYYIKTKNN